MRPSLYTALFSLTFCGLAAANCKDEFEKKQKVFDEIYKLSQTKETLDGTFDRVMEDTEIKELLSIYHKSKADLKRLEDLRFKREFKGGLTNLELEEFKSLARLNLFKISDDATKAIAIQFKRNPSLKKLEQEGYSVAIDERFPGTLHVVNHIKSGKPPSIKTNSPAFCEERQIEPNESIFHWNVLDADFYRITLAHPDKDKKINSCNEIELGEAIGNSLDSRTYCAVSIAYDYTKIHVGFRKTRAEKIESISEENNKPI